MNPSAWCCITAHTARLVYHANVEQLLTDNYMYVGNRTVVRHCLYNTRLSVRYVTLGSRINSTRGADRRRQRRG